MASGTDDDRTADKGAILQQLNTAIMEQRANDNAMAVDMLLTAGEDFGAKGGTAGQDELRRTCLRN